MAGLRTYFPAALRRRILARFNAARLGLARFFSFFLLRFPILDAIPAFFHEAGLIPRL